MNEMQTMLKDSAQRLFADLLTPQARAAAESGQWQDAPWQAIEASGLLNALLPESAGGSGLGWADVYPLVFEAGRQAISWPLVDTLAARWLVERAALPIPPGPLTLAAPIGGNATLLQAPWAKQVAGVVLVHGGDRRQLELLDAFGDEAANVVGVDAQPMARLALSKARVRAQAPLPATTVDSQTLGAMLRAAQIAGALSQALTISIDYVNTRVQFGKPLGRFQAIQHQLAQLAGQTAAAGAAARAAFEALDQDEAKAAFDIAVAKQRASEAAQIGAAIAHQVHGAIGITQEYSLHPLTRRLWAWSAEYGTTAYWSGCVADIALDQEHGVWEFLTAR